MVTITLYSHLTSVF